LQRTLRLPLVCHCARLRPFVGDPRADRAERSVVAEAVDRPERVVVAEAAGLPARARHRRFDQPRASGYAAVATRRSLASHENLERIARCRLRSQVTGDSSVVQTGAKGRPRDLHRPVGQRRILQAEAIDPSATAHATHASSSASSPAKPPPIPPARFALREASPPVLCTCIRSSSLASESATCAVRRTALT
jgi:hypothetical protein